MKTYSFTKAGSWIPVQDKAALSGDYSGSLANTFHGIVALGSTGQYGLVITGWGYSGWPPTLKTYPKVSMTILAPKMGGGFSVATEQLIDDPVTNGGGSVIVADFNQDGLDDFFLPAHNESPFIAAPSTAYLADSTGGYRKVVLDDHVMAHDAQLVILNGKPMVLTASFTHDNLGNKDPNALSNPIYVFENGSFKVASANNFASGVFGMSVAVVDGSEKHGPLLVRGGVASFSYEGKLTAQTINTYRFDGLNVISDTPVQTIIPYLSTLAAFKDFPAQIGGPGMTHTPRVWVDDLNHDGYQDILAAQSMWSQSAPDFPSALQILINDGTGQFKDATAQLNPELELLISEHDYTPFFADIDNSGINTYILSGQTSWGSMNRQSNYLLLNDGSGRLHAALHDEFNTLAQQVLDYLGISPSEDTTPPRFIGVPQSDGSVEYIAEVPTSVYDAGLQKQVAAYEFINTHFRYNPSTDFVRDISVQDRNHAQKLRTWAGNDVFNDVNAGGSGSTTIHGGAGFDTSVYSRPLSHYSVTRDDSGSVNVRYLGTEISPAVNDMLSQIERLHFTDFTVNLTVQALAESLPTALVQHLQELYVAFFNRVPDADGLAYWLTQAKGGASIPDIANSFYWAGMSYPELTGFHAGMTDADFVNIIYKNALGRPEGADLEGLNYWVNELQNGTATRGTVVSTILHAAHSYAGDATWGWVADLLTNKLTVANLVAVDWGLNYLDDASSIYHGAKIAGAVTPTDIEAAITLVGLSADMIAL